MGMREMFPVCIVVTGNASNEGLTVAGFLLC